MFKAFDKYTCDGDTRECEIGKFTLSARIARDHDANKPDEMSDVFWPERTDYATAGEFEAAADQAQRVMDAWLADEWWYVGVVVTAHVDDIEIAHESLWGIECNYPGSDNSYLTDVANDLATEAVMAARAKLAKLCATQ